MKLHTSLTADTVRQVVHDLIPGVTVVIEEHGSRSHERRLDFRPYDNGTLTVKGRRMTSNIGDFAGRKGITYDEWGIVLNALYDLDPDMHATYYQNRDDFHAATGGRFRRLTWEGQHGRHRWDFKSAGEFACQCGARKLYLSRGFAA